MITEKFWRIFIIKIPISVAQSSPTVSHLVPFLVSNLFVTLNGVLCWCAIKNLLIFTLWGKTPILGQYRDSRDLNVLLQKWSVMYWFVDVDACQRVKFIVICDAGVGVLVGRTAAEGEERRRPWSHYCSSSGISGCYNNALTSWWAVSRE